MEKMKTIVESAQRFFACGLNIAVLVALLLAGARASAADLQFTNVSVSPRILQHKHDTAAISFHLNQAAAVTAKIYDARDILIWQQRSGELPAGDHLIQWGAVDNAGRAVEPEAYFYVLEAINNAGEKVSFDLTDITGGETIRVDGARYDPKKKSIRFTAPNLGRYFIRAGVSQSFAVNTLINNEVVTEGEQDLKWDGFDASHVFSVADHPKLLLGGFGYRLSDNAIVVKGNTVLDAANARIQRWAPTPKDAERRLKMKIARDNVDPGFYRSVDRNRDVVLKLVLPADIKKRADGVPIIQGATPVRIELSAEDAEVMETQRGEMVFFWDNQLIYDNEVSYYPYTFNWQPQVLDGKTHLLTGFVAGFGGNLALATIKVQLGSAEREGSGSE